MARRRSRYEWNPIWRRGAAAAAAASGDPNFANVSLLLPFNGADAATATTDLSNTGHTVTFAGDAQLDTANPKFGSAALLLDGALGDLISVPDHADFTFGSGDFTVELHADFDFVTSYRTLYRKEAASNHEFMLKWDNATNLIFYWSTSGTAYTGSCSYAWSPSTGVYYHIAIVRDGNTLRMFIDGTQVQTADLTGVTFYDGTAPVEFGGDAGTDQFAGHMDNIRITKGVARYTGNFTAPTAEYPTS